MDSRVPVIAVLLAFPSLVCAQTSPQPLSLGASLGVAFGLIGALILAFVVVGIVLWYKNKHGEKVETTHPHVILRFVKFFFQYLFFELITLPFLIGGAFASFSWFLCKSFLAGIIELETQDWTPLYTVGIRIAFYVFVGLKLALVISIILVENLFLYHQGPLEQEETIKKRWNTIGRKMFLPGTWVSMVEVGIFVPLTIIEGMITNGEIYMSVRYPASDVDLEGFIPYEGIILLILDSILYLKLCLFYSIEVHGRPRPYKIPDLMYNMVMSVVTLAFVYVYVVYHLANMFAASIDYNIGAAPLLIVVIVIAITHQITAGYTTMLLQAMIHRSRALGKSEAKVKQVELYIKWLSTHPIAIILNIIVYCWQFASYVIMIYVASSTINLKTGDGAIDAMILVVSVLALVLLSWLLINFVYGSLKRLGSLVPFVAAIGSPLTRIPTPSWMWPIQFNNISYSKTLNQIISDCGGGFAVDDFVRRRI